MHECALHRRLTRSGKLPTQPAVKRWGVFTKVAARISKVSTQFPINSAPHNDITKDNSFRQLKGRKNLRKPSTKHVPYKRTPFLQKNFSICYVILYSQNHLSLWWVISLNSLKPTRTFFVVVANKNWEVRAKPTNQSVAQAVLNVLEKVLR